MHITNSDSTPLLPVYQGVITRFLRPEERLIQSQETAMPLVIEATNETKTFEFLQRFLQEHSVSIMENVARFGAILFRGFPLETDAAFEEAVLRVRGLRGISDVFMAEAGRIHAGKLKYVLHTNAIYKTGGTLYLGGFHSENYYSTDVPTYLAFCCLQPSRVGGETGLINTTRFYPLLSQPLRETLENRSFFVSKWLVSEVAEKYNLPTHKVESLANQFNLPLSGEGKNKFILMYKPNVFEDPQTGQKALQINFFEVPELNEALRRCFESDYAGNKWFWHRFVWHLPHGVFKFLEASYLMTASLLYSPKEAVKTFSNKSRSYLASLQCRADQQRVGSCFSSEDVQELAQHMRNFYCSCLWQKGDLLLIDNRKVVHAGMPGAGSRLIRAMICNPVKMDYQVTQSGTWLCQESSNDTLGFYASHPLENGLGGFRE
ncbi:MAG: TauD/TfdA family dioxygenase [Legionella sp.]|nr:TauD/TfdA family dioxygenase [Legionella sp.]